MPNNKPNESVESPSQKEKPILDTAIRSYVEERFSKEGAAFYDRFLQLAEKETGMPTDKAKKGEKREIPPLSADFRSFLASQEGFKTLLTRQFFPKALFEKEVEKIGFQLESLKDSANKAILLEYELGDGERKNLNVRLSEMNVDALKRLIGSTREKEDLIAAITGSDVKYARDDWHKFVQALRSEARLTDVEIRALEGQKERLKEVKDAMLQGSFSEDHVRTVLWFVRNEESKRSLVKAFLPEISVAELVRLKIYGKKEAAEAVKEKIDELARKNANGMSAKLKAGNAAWLVADAAESAFETVDWNSVFVDTKTLKPGHLDVLLKKSKVPEILEDKISQGLSELRDMLDVEKDLKPDAQGKTAVPFVKKLLKEFSDKDSGKTMANAERLLSSAKGDHLEEDGTVIEGVLRDEANVSGSKIVRFRIDSWWENQPDAARSKTVRIRPLSENGDPAEPTDLGYDEFYRLLWRLDALSANDPGTMGQKLRIEASGTKSAIRTAKAIGNETLRDEAFANVDVPKIQSLEELETMLDEIDSAGSKHGMKNGTTVVLGKPSDKHFNVATIVSTNANDGTVTIKDTRSLGERNKTFAFGEFYLLAQIDGLSRRGGVSTAREVLNAISETPSKDFFEDIVLEEDGGRVKMTPKIKRGAHDYPGVSVFYNKETGAAFEISELLGDSLQIRKLDSFNPGEQAKGVPANAPASEGFGTYGYETLYFLIRKHNLSPFPGDVKPVEIYEPKFESEGRMKNFLNHASFYDFIHGLQEIPKFIKKKLEHSSHHHAAHVTLAVAEMIPFFPKDWLTDLQMEIHNEDKSALGKEVDRLNSFPSGKRHEQALGYLLNKGAHDYEVIAATLSLLEKHGNLYPWILAKYEKDWIFFWRMPGDAAEKQKFLQEKRVGADGREKEIREPEMIMLWLQKLASAEHHPLSPYYWLEVKKRWRSGTAGEFEMGGKESQGKETMKDRADYAISKFKGKEYAHGIGAMEEIWNKGNGMGETVADRMRVPFVLALSNIRKNIHADLAQKFTPMFDSGHVYPPLLFIQHGDRQQLFRKVIKAIAGSKDGGGNAKYPGMMGDFRDLEGLMDEVGVSVSEKNGKDEVLIEKLDAFWKKHGKTLSKKLLVTPEDPEILLRKNEEPVFAEYLEIVGGEYGNSKFDGTEIDCGTYEVGSANWALVAPGTYVRQFKVQAGHGGFNSELEIYLFNKFMEGIEAVRNNGNLSKEEKKTLFREYHKNFLQYVQERLSPDKFAEDPKTGRPKLEQETYMRRLNERFGFTAPRSKAAGEFEGDRYETWLEEDFKRFLSIKDSKQYGEQVATNINDIITRTGTTANESGGGPSDRDPAENEGPSGSDARPAPTTSESVPTPSPEEGDDEVEEEEKYAKIVRELSESHPELEIDSRIDAGINQAVAKLESLWIRVDPEMRRRNWIEKAIGRHVESSFDAWASTLDFDISYVVERRVGEKIHEHYRIKLTAEERSAFDTKIPNVEEKEEVLEHLKKPVGLTKDDFATIGAVFLNAS